MARSSKRRSKRSSPRVTRSTSRTIIKSAGSSSAVWMGALALAGVAVVGTAVYFTEKKANAAPSPGVLPPPAPNPNPAPGPTPSQLPQTGDVYGSLSAAQQAAVNAALYAYAVQGYGGCPGIFANQAAISSNGITAPASIADAGNRSLVVDCFQTATGLQVPSQGTLDLATYRSLMGV